MPPAPESNSGKDIFRSQTTNSTLRFIVCFQMGPRPPPSTTPIAHTPHCLSLLTHCIPNTPLAYLPLLEGYLIIAQHHGCSWRISLPKYREEIEKMTYMPRISVLLLDSHNQSNPRANRRLWPSVKNINILSEFCCDDG